MPRSEGYFVVEVLTETTFGERSFGAAKVPVADVSVVPRSEWYKLGPTMPQTQKHPQGLPLMPRLADPAFVPETPVTGDVHVTVTPIDVEAPPGSPAVAVAHGESADDKQEKRRRKHHHHKHRREGREFKEKEGSASTKSSSKSRSSKAGSSATGSSSTNSTTSTAKTTTKENKAEQQDSAKSAQSVPAEESRATEPEKQSKTCSKEKEATGEQQKPKAKTKPTGHAVMHNIPEGRLIDCVFVAGEADNLVEEAEKAVSGALNSDGVSRLTGAVFQAKLHDAYPWLGKDDPPAASWIFCVPGGFRVHTAPQAPHVFSFVMTSTEGTRRYLTCLAVSQPLSAATTQRIAAAVNRHPTANPLDPDRPLYFPRCYCLRSSVPCFAFCRAWLRVFYRECVQPARPRTAEHMIAQLLKQVPLPLPHVPVSLSITGRDGVATSIGTVRADRAGGMHRLDFPMRLVLDSLRPDALVRLFAALLLDQKVVVVSESMTLLTMTIETLSALLYPLVWQYIYIPVLPDSLTQLLMSVQPSLTGLSRACAQKAPPECLSDAVTFDVDERTLIVPPGAELPPLPQGPLETLRQDLSDIFHTFVDGADSLNWSETATAAAAAAAGKEEGEMRDSAEADEELGARVQAAFLRFFLAILDDYRSYMVFYRAIPQPSVVFDQSRFQDEQAGGAEEFYARLFGTQPFVQFLDTHTQPRFNTADNLLVHNGKDMSFDEVLRAVKEALDSGPTTRECQVHCVLPEIEGDADESMTMSAEAIDAVPLEPFQAVQEVPVDSEHERQEQEAQKSFFELLEEKEKETHDRPLLRCPTKLRRLVENLVEVLQQAGNGNADFSTVPQVTEYVKLKEGRKVLATLLAAQSEEAKWNGKLSDAGFVVLCDLFRVAMLEAFKQKEFHTPTMFLDLANKCYHIANGAEETVMDRLRSLSVWQKIPFWEDYFYVRANKKLRELHKPSITHQMLRMERMSEEERKELDAKEQDAIFNLLASFVFDMSKLAVPARTINVIAFNIGNKANLNKERRDMLKVLVQNMMKMELPEMAAFGNVEGVVGGGGATTTGAGGSSSSSEVPEERENKWISVQDKGAGDAKWHADFSKLLASATEDGRGLAEALDEQMSRQQQQQQQPQNTVLHKSAHVASRVVEKVLVGHTAPVLCLAALPRGMLASGSCDNTIRVWSTAQGACVQTLPHHTGWVNCLAYDPPSAHLLSGSYDRTVTLWDAGKLAKLHTLRGHEGSVTCLAVYPRGNAVSAAMDSRVIVWDTRARRAAMQLLGHERAPLCLRTVGETYLLSGGRDKSVRVWDLRTGRPLWKMVGHTDWVRCLVCTGDLANFVPISAGLDGRVVSWNMRTGKAVNAVQAHDGAANTMFLSGYFRSLVTAGGDNLVKLWDPFTFKLRATLTGHTDEITTATAFGRFIATGSADHKVKLWNPLINKEPRPSRAHTPSLSPLPPRQRSPEETGTTNTKQESLELPLCRQTLTGHTLQVTDMCELSEFSLATSGWDSTVRLWQITEDFY